MKIAVYAPKHRQGSTTITLLLGHLLANRTSKKVCINHTGADSEVMRQCLNLDEEDDITKSTNQMIKMLELGVITDENINNYLIRLNNNLDISLVSSEYRNEDLTKLNMHMVESLPHDIIVTDVCTEAYDQQSINAFKSADIIVAVVSQAWDVIEEFQRWKDSSVFPGMEKVVVIVNGYNPNISALRDVSRSLGVKHNKVAKMSDNPLICKFSNNGELDYILDLALEKDVRVLELYEEFRSIYELLAVNFGLWIKWKE